MKKVLNLGLLIALVLSINLSCSKSEDDEEGPSGWSDTTCLGTDACIDFTQSSEGDIDPTCGKFEGFTTADKSSCDASCIGRCVDVKGTYYTFTKHYYGPAFTNDTAKVDCETKVTPTNGTAGIYTAGCS